jgi:SagB-type dehydrogenase family enzyme
MVLLVPIVVVGCATTADDPEANPAVGQYVELPPPAQTSDVSLEEALAARRSVREYSEKPLSQLELSQLLWAAQGETSDSGKRSAPSAGALYPLEVYVVAPDGISHYEPNVHRLEIVGTSDRRTELMAAALDQEAVGGAAAVFVVAGVEARTAAKYGGRAKRYVALEAGHAAQNLLLQAVALGLGAVPIGAYDDEAVRALLALPEGHDVLYLVPVGHLRSGS